VKDQKFDKLLNYLRRVPAISGGAIGTSTFDDGNWWVKFGKVPWFRDGNILSVSEH